ncbi:MULTISPECIES: ABC transporter substrate-binding protein [Streptomyces]|uniref:Fe/B12 periplasmic-binding domain-containing protein n=1 Tax=Streptomyces venezuelae TaxID=54571 RepID=A0A5P2BAF7_STRVZ|nr:MULTISPECIES: ABC transporter substrate-binding protein [Streptomyces]NEA00329.1 ABC transporter substrate-binding protein [Streptomyces sp. SID10116]MYY81065.1 ABC transporter substrate-binding protein [Streptomyces sp. SID335]MYZ19328.1 ABC transporter substrate-binding protein [Streptomyces sp. SID337]NDZ87836.1 ABC transporter substrate-binding protein [Streptomyces sp. SID10115]NEB48339.1 ABC transporter substrate-binding protein [Streptomyces sp. SID339]
MSRRHTGIRALAAAALLVPLAACSSSSTSDGEGDGTTAAKAAGFPYTVTNCGVKTTYDAPPKRAVTMNQHTTEVMLELGLKDHLAGTAYLDDKVLPKYEKAYDSVPVVAKEYPSYEKLLAANPDFVYGGYASAFLAGDGRSRSALAKSGIKSRLNVEGCAKKPVSMDDVYREVREVGSTFGVRDRADTWVRGAQRELAATAEKSKGKKALSVFVYDSGDKTAFTAGGRGIGNDIIKRAGGRNVFAHVDKSFSDASWESVVKNKPEAILILDYGATTVAQKKKRLLDDPVLQDVPAIKNKRFAVLPLSDMVTGVRAPEAVRKLAAQL